ncbi:retrovirus-related pol polyprotein from transposon TNT 1-94 [Tanacetum coccineum]
MNEDKVKKDLEEIEMINIELDHRVSNLIAKNEHLKQTYKQLYDSIKPARIRSKEQCNVLINKFNQKSVEISDLNAKIQEQGLTVTALKDELRKLKGKDLADNVVCKHTIDPEMLKIDVQYLNPRLLNNRSVHSDYLKHTQEEAAILREIVEHGKSQNPLNESLDSALGKCVALTRITITAEVPLRIPTALESDTPKLVVTLVYSMKPRKSITNVPVSKPKIVKSISANKKEPSRPNYSLIGNVMISMVYYVEGLGHNLFSVRQFCYSNLEVAYRQHTCFICNLEGVDLLTGSRGNNLYTLYLGDMMASSPICLLSKASKTKSWLWHRRLSHLNFGEINNLARHGLVRGLPKLKFEKDHLCSASSVNGKKYILVNVDDYSRFTWVKCLRSKDEALDFIIKFLKMIQVRLKEPVRLNQIEMKTEFVNQILREYYEKVGISHETSVARSLQQNGVVERRTRAQPPPSTSFVPPLRTDWDILFQPPID